MVEGLGYVVAGSLWSNQISANKFLNTPPRSAYLIVYVGVVNGNSEPYMLPPLKLVDENGTEYAPSHNDWILEESLKPIENLNPEVPVGGTIAFDVPKNHRYRLKVMGGILSQEFAYIELDPK